LKFLSFQECESLGDFLNKVKRINCEKYDDLHITLQKKQPFLTEILRFYGIFRLDKVG
jgi:hypothetical protein